MLLKYSVIQELQKFDFLIKKLSRQYYVENDVEDAFILTDRNTSHLSSEIDLCFAALVHGNEWGSLVAVNQLLQTILDLRLTLGIRLAIILGNRRAAKIRQRFLQRDLNRSFAAQGKHLDTFEGQRALELEIVLKKTRFFIDFHQTIQANTTPFFIFPYQYESVVWAYKMAPFIPIVTHYKGSFSEDGLCTDEFVNRKGGIGITLETGACGFDSYQTSTGLLVALKALTFSSAKIFDKTSLRKETVAEDAALFTFQSSLKLTKTENSQLVQGLHNFSNIEKDQLIAYDAGKPIYASHGGYVLFPKYPKKTTSFENYPSEWLRVLEPLDLPEIENLVAASKASSMNDKSLEQPY